MMFNIYDGPKAFEKFFYNLPVVFKAELDLTRFQSTQIGRIKIIAARGKSKNEMVAMWFAKS